MDPLMDMQQLADFLGVPKSWVKDKVAAREIPITWVGKHARFDLKDIATWLAEHKEFPAGAPAPLRLINGPKPPAGPAHPRPPSGPVSPSKGRAKAS